MRRIYVLNPNSSRVVTEGILQSLAPFNCQNLEIKVDQLDNGPKYIEGYKDEAFVAPIIVERLFNLKNQYDIFVIACHGDPGLDAAREATYPKKVVGIGEASMLAACAVARCFGVITLHSSLVPKKWHQVHSYGLGDRCVAIEPTEKGVLDSLEYPNEILPYLDAAKRAISKGAQAIVLGCAGMAHLAKTLSLELEVPVLDPVYSAVSISLGMQVL
jgi:allantoin racemase